MLENNTVVPAGVGEVGGWQALTRCDGGHIPEVVVQRVEDVGRKIVVVFSVLSVRYKGSTHPKANWSACENKKKNRDRKKLVCLFYRAQPNTYK